MNITDKSTYHDWISNIQPDSILPEEAVSMKEKSHVLGIVEQKEGINFENNSREV